MDGEWLRRELGRGQSIEAIASQSGRHPSTVAYWVNNHQLTSCHRTKHLARGGIEEAQLRSLVERGLSVREIAATCGLSATSVRHWLRRFGLRTRPSRYARRDDPKLHEILRECKVHGWTAFRPTGRARGYRCPRCNTERVARRRRRVKELLVAEAGGACQRCGYKRHTGALHFHHLDPTQKRFQLSEQGRTRALAHLREEARRCLLLCANCHAEVEAGVAILPSSRVLNDPG